MSMRERGEREEGEGGRGGGRREEGEEEGAGRREKEGGGGRRRAEGEGRREGGGRIERFSFLSYNNLKWISSGKVICVCNCNIVNVLCVKTMMGL